MSKILYTYGTLRPGGPNTVTIPGKLYDLGWFPGLVMGQGEVVAEKIEVEDWARVDRYEGYHPDDHEGSMYIRRPFLDGFIYEYNRRVSEDKLVECGDWLVYKNAEGGINAGRV